MTHNSVNSPNSPFTTHRTGNNPQSAQSTVFIKRFLAHFFAVKSFFRTFAATLRRTCLAKGGEGVGQNILEQRLTTLCFWFL